MLQNIIRIASAGAVLSAGICAAQQQEQPPNVFIRDFCVKVADGKWAEFAAFTKDVNGKVLQARVDLGQAAWALVARVVSPAGTTAPCDYHVVYGYAGTLPEGPGPESTEAALKHAGIRMNAEEFVAKRDSLSRLVRAEVFRGIDAVPFTVAKGTYFRLNHYRTRPGQSIASWLELERTVWKPLVVADKEAGGKSGWSVSTLMMPSGEMIWANGLTVDTFPDWASLMRGIAPGELWPKVHKNRSMTEWSDRMSTLVERRLVEVAQAVEYAAPKNSAVGTQ